MVRSTGLAIDVLYLFRAESAVFPAQPTSTWPDEEHASTDNYGTDATGGQLIGRDGRWDVVVAAPGTRDAGKVYVYRGPELMRVAPLELDNPDTTGRSWLGSPSQVPGDVNGDYLY